ncbi:unnamed protein product [Trichogramma brassicae]|uniref:Uncharacterized protein n=1 Tax=Trichogramma brassicae TaxID=86971 RepID=A0A6H5IGR0_9HYME|nr:unnamed protein product [Trichogramma brassicae]
MCVLLTIGFLKIKRIDNDRPKNIFQDLRERSYGACIQTYNALSVPSGVIKKIIAPHPLVLPPRDLAALRIYIHARASKTQMCVRAAAKLGLGIVCLDLSRRSRLFLESSQLLGNRQRRASTSRVQSTALRALPWLYIIAFIRLRLARAHILDGALEEGGKKLRVATFAAEKKNVSNSAENPRRGKARAESTSARRRARGNNPVRAVLERKQLRPKVDESTRRALKISFRIVIASAAAAAVTATAAASPSRAKIHRRVLL